MGGKRKQDAMDKWKVLMTTTLIQSIIGGVVESYGAFFVPMMTNVFKNDPQRPTKAALIGSLASGFQLGFSPVSSILTEKIGPLVVGVLGGIIVFLATFSASFAREFMSMAFAYGICLGIGCSLLFITNNIIISQHFREDSTLAFGLLGFGNGVMNAVMPHIMAYAVEKISLFGAIRTISLILSPMMFLPFYWKEIPIEHDKENFGGVFKNMKESESSLYGQMTQENVDNQKMNIPSKQTNKNNMSNKTTQRKNEHKFYSRQMWKSEITDFDMVVLKKINLTNTSNAAGLFEKRSSTFEVNDSDNTFKILKPEKEVNEMFKAFSNKGFLNLCFAMVISSLGYQVANIHMVNFSNDLNLYGNAQILLTCLGGASAVGPLINPLFIDKFEEHISKFRMFQIFVLIYGVTVTFLPLVKNFNILMFLCVIIGYADGSFSTLVVPLIIDLVGTENSGHCIGVYYGSISISVTIAAPLAGFIYSTNNSYTPAFYAAGLLFITGGLLLSLTHKDLKYVDPKIVSSDLATIIQSKLSPSNILESKEYESKENYVKKRESKVVEKKLKNRKLSKKNSKDIANILEKKAKKISKKFSFANDNEMGVKETVEEKLNKGESKKIKADDDIIDGEAKKISDVDEIINKIKGKEKQRLTVKEAERKTTDM